MMKELILLLCVILLAGCGFLQPGSSNVRNFIEEVKASGGSLPDPLPGVSSPPHFEYRQQDSRSPFQEPVRIRIAAPQPQQNNNKSSVLPPSDNIVSVLPNIALNEINMVSVIHNRASGAIKAQVQGSSGDVQIVKVGSYIGSSKAQVKRIVPPVNRASDSLVPGKMILEEIVPVGDGTYVAVKRLICLRDTVCTDTE